MSKDKKNSAKGASLRDRAEEQLQRNLDSERSKADQSEADMMKLVHELEVYKVELEIQNDELKRASEKAEIATEKYTAIYDFAYTGYFTLDADGHICELNHSGAKMLNMERSTLVNGNFKQFVTIDTRSEFNDFILKVFESNSRQSCDVRLIVKENTAIFVHLEAIASGDDDKCLVTVVNITRRKQAEAILKLKDQEFELFNELMDVNDKQMIELKKEINSLLNKLGEKDKFQVKED